MRYSELKKQQPVLEECFFAFSNEQFAEGVKEHNLEGKKIYSGEYGLYGTADGIQKFYAAYEAIELQIIEQCSPQEVYDYEFDNHDCTYVGDDEEAIDIVLNLFGVEKAKTVVRKYGYKQL